MRHVGHVRHLGELRTRVPWHGLGPRARSSTPVARGMGPVGPLAGYGSPAARGRIRGRHRRLADTSRSHLADFNDPTPAHARDGDKRRSGGCSVRRHRSEADRLAHAANVTRDTARGSNTREARALPPPNARPSSGQGRGDNRRVPQAVWAELVRGGDAGGAGEAADEAPHGGFGGRRGRSPGRGRVAGASASTLRVPPFRVRASTR
jgi:hypothetical protein